MLNTKLDRLYLQFEKIKSISPTNTLLANGDTPVASLIQAISDAESELAKTKMAKVEAEIFIERRKRGLFAVIPALLK